MNARVISLALLFGIVVGKPAAAGGPVRSAEAAALAREAADQGWIVASGRSVAGDWDLFLMRPDGSARRNITNTPDYDEMGARFSADGKRLLFRQLAKGTKFTHDNWGSMGRLVFANSDGTGAEACGKPDEFPWATWSPDGKQIACLAKTGIEIWDLEKKTRLRTLGRKGIFQQFFWSPDGRWFTGPASGYGEAWAIVRMNAVSGEVDLVSKYQTCTPDFFPDSHRIIYSSRPKQKDADGGTKAAAVGQRVNYGWTQLWMANGDGSNPALVYGEDGCHVYGGALSPDGKYVLFTRSSTDGGMDSGVIAIMRFADAPTIGGESKALRQLHPATKDGPVVAVAPGWEPHWTHAEIGRGK